MQDKLDQLKAADLRELFFREIGFPLIKANAMQYIPDVGDLRKTENIRLVVKVALERKAVETEQRRQQAEAARIEKARYAAELTAQASLLQSFKARVKARVQELERQLEEKEQEVMQSQEKQQEPMEPEDYLAQFVASVDESVGEPVVNAAITAQVQQGKEFSAVYRKLAIAFHPDSSKLEEQKATEAFKVLSRTKNVSSNEEIITDDDVWEQQSTSTKEAERREMEYFRIHFPDKGHYNDQGEWELWDIPI
jgi:uncharacterized protein with von Willebrand factor type A (vWA) domain